VTTRRLRLTIGVGLLLAIFVALFAIFGSEGQNTEYQPQNEFKLDDWIPIHIGSLNLSINKAVLYLFLATAITVWLMVYVARRMQDRPNRVQTAVESIYDLAYRNITRGNMDDKMAIKWFPVVATLFVWIMVSNILGYIPLPTNSLEKFNVFGAHIPGFAIYAATANISIPLTLTLIVWISYHVEGIRAKGLRRYLASWVPAGVPSAARAPLFAIEVISHFVRLISLTVRLFANILAGHMLILFMGGGLTVLLGLAALGVITVPIAVVFFIFEVVLIATLQAYIFATLTAIYLGGAVAETH
jgi:F-type H+-transporting ATPase subunit a